MTVSQRELWEVEARNWLHFVRTGRLSGERHPAFNQPHFLMLLPPPAGPVLEIGCGEGRFTRVLRAVGYDASGIDVAAELVRAAERADPRGRYLVADAAALPFADASFDLVVAFMSLHHVDELERAVVEVARVLTPAGRFCFAIPHPLSTAGRLVEPGSGTTFAVDESYFETRPIVVSEHDEDVSLTIQSWHRPLTVYTSALERAGLALEVLREPRPSAELADAERESIWHRIPHVLHGRAAHAA